MKKLALLAVALFVLGGTAAFAQDVRYDYAQGTNFSQFKTYKWVAIPGAELPDQLVAQRITAAVDLELSRKGLTKTDSEDADLYIGYQTAETAEKQYRSFNTGWGYGPGWGPHWYGYGGMPTSTYGYTSTVYVGQLDLSIYDRAAQKLVWRGVATKTLDPKANPKKIQKTINKAVQKLLKNFPPKK